ncbi:unnamed protein product, partial [Meganyctiphanes norvegica]
SYVKAFGPAAKRGIPLTTDQKWVQAVIEAQRAIMMPKFSRSNLLATMPPSDDSDCGPDNGSKSSEKSSENDSASEDSYRGSKKTRNRTVNSNTSSSESSTNSYENKKINKLKMKYLKKTRRKNKKNNIRRILDNYIDNSEIWGHFQKLNPLNSGIAMLSRRQRLILDEHFTHDNLIPFDAQKDLAKELNLTQETVGQYLDYLRRLERKKIKIFKEGDRVYSCRICPVRYIWKQSLDHHMQLHSPERGLKCSDCSSAFEHPSVYYHHLRYKGHNASREIDEYLKKLTEHAISVKDLINDLNYIFTDTYNKKCCNLDLEKIVDKVYELQCQPGAQCQCDDEYSDRVPQYIQDMFQGMDNPDDFIIVDDDDLIYMGKGSGDELVPMIIKTGAEMLAASDVSYKKFSYKFRPPNNLAQWAGDLQRIATQSHLASS